MSSMSYSRIIDGDEDGSENKEDTNRSPQSKPRRPQQQQQQHHHHQQNHRHSPIHTSSSSIVLDPSSSSPLLSAPDEGGEATALLSASSWLPIEPASRSDDHSPTSFAHSSHTLVRINNNNSSSSNMSHTPHTSSYSGASSTSSSQLHHPTPSHSISLTNASSLLGIDASNNTTAIATNSNHDPLLGSNITTRSNSLQDGETVASGRRSKGSGAGDTDQRQQHHQDEDTNTNHARHPSMSAQEESEQLTPPQQDQHLPSQHQRDISSSNDLLRVNTNLMTAQSRQTPDLVPSRTVSRQTSEEEQNAADAPKYTHWGSKFLPGPPCVRNILGNELCERFSFYGLRSILVLYFHEGLGWSKDSSISIFSYTTALAYFLPLFGGYLSDARLGKFRTILYFSLLYIAGLVLLSFSAIRGVTWLSITGLLLICVGTGGIKPCVSSFGADQFTNRHITSHEQLKAREIQISSFFLMFYFSINLGSVGSFILTPILKKEFGYAVAFGVPAALLIVATGIFVSARKEYYRAPIAGSVLARVMKVFTTAWTKSREMKREEKARRDVEREDGRNNQDMDNEAPPTPRVRVTSTTPTNWLDSALLDPSITRGEVENAKSLYRVLPIFAVLPVFWMLFDQQSSSWTLQADEMKLYGIQPEQVGVVNPILIMILLPIFEHLIYPTIQRCNINLTALRRMGVGMVISIFAFLLSAGLQYQITQLDEKSVSVFWQLPQVFLISLAEVFISTTGLEFAYTQSTPQLKSSITAIYLITTAIGNLLTGVLYTALSKVMTMTEMYVLFAGLMLANFFAFLFVSSRYTPVLVLDDAVRGIEEENETEEEKLQKIQIDGEGGVDQHRRGSSTSDSFALRTPSESPRHPHPNNRSIELTPLPSVTSLQTRSSRPMRHTKNSSTNFSMSLAPDE